MWRLTPSNEHVIKAKRAARDKALADCSAGASAGSAIVSATGKTPILHFTPVRVGADASDLRSR